MAVVFAPVVDPGTAMQLLGDSAPAPDGRFANDRFRWIGVGPGATLHAFANGVVTAVRPGASNGLPGKPASAWMLIEFTPLPQLAPDVFKALPGGLPILIMLLEGSSSPASIDDYFLRTAAIATAPAGAGNTAFFTIAFQDRACRDPLSWAEALASTGAVAADFNAFVNAIGALPGARTIFALDHMGQPLKNGTVAVSVDGGPLVKVAFPPHTDGNTGIVLPAASTAVVSLSSSANPIVAGVGSDTGAFTAPLSLGPGKRLAQVLDADSWLAPRDAGVTGAARWRANSHLTPMVDGTAYFTDLVAELRNAMGGGAVEFAGWSFVKGSLADSSIEWPLIAGQDDGANDTRFLSLVRQLRGNGVAMRFLVNKFLQFDSALIDDFPELPILLLVILSGLAPAQALFKAVTDPAGYSIATVAAVALVAFFKSNLTEDLISDFLEYSRETVKELLKIAPDLAVWTPYPATFADNPLLTMPLTVLGHTIDDFSHLGVYHQKFINIQRGDKSFVSYLGGMDISNDRVDTPMHRALHPFHDVQVKISGPAVQDLILSFSERAEFHGAKSVIPAPAAVPDAGHHLIQIARTYYRPKAGSGSKPFDAAKNGESTTINTLKNAIRSARDFIYIEDQYFTPPDDYVQELLNAADTSRNVKALLITVPYHTDQPYGGIRRAGIIDELTKAWGPRFNIGTLFRRYLHATPALVTNLGRLHVVNAIGASDNRMTVAPAVHMPVPPFWAYVNSELVLVPDTLGPPGASGEQTLNIVRGGGWGANPVTHQAGAPVLCAQVPGIYVHAKVTIVDDVFLFAGSSNMNRRGTYHDGEINSCTISEHLKSDPANPARLLRCRLWAEHLGLPPEVGISLLADPLSAIPLFKARNWYRGSHRQSLGFIYSGTPPVASIGLTTSPIMETLRIAASTLNVTLLEKDIWPSMADPTTELQPSPRKPGPQYP